jgi:hypothetical protein
MQKFAAFLEFVPTNAPVYGNPLGRLVGISPICPVVGQLPRYQLLGDVWDYSRSQSTIGSRQRYSSRFAVRKNQGQFRVVGLALPRDDHLDDSMLCLSLSL